MVGYFSPANTFISLPLKVKGGKQLLEKKRQINPDLFCKPAFAEEILWGEDTKSARINRIGQVPVEQSGEKNGNTGKNVFSLDITQVYINTQETAGCEHNWCHSDLENILEFLLTPVIVQCLCTKQMQTTARKRCSAHPCPQLRTFSKQKASGRILAPIYWCGEPLGSRGAWISHKKLKIYCLQSFGS